MEIVYQETEHPQSYAFFKARIYYIGQLIISPFCSCIDHILYLE